MSNNRLYIADPEDKEYAMMSKGFGCGWNGVSNLEGLDEFLCSRSTPEGECGCGTKLILFTEYDPLYEEVTKKGTEWQQYPKK